MNFFSLPLLTTDQPASNPLMTFAFPLLVLVVVYFVMMRPQQKKQKEEAKMRSQIDVGDDVVTIGGIVGIVVSIKEDTLVIETGSDRSKIRVQRWAIQQNMTQKEDPAPAKPAKGSKK